MATTFTTTPFHLVLVGVFLIWSAVRFGMAWGESNGWSVVDNLLATFVSLILIVSWFISVLH